MNNTSTTRARQRARPSLPVTGFYTCRDGTLIRYDSLQQKEWITTLEYMPTTKDISTSPFTVEYYDAEGDRRYYTPPLLATHEIQPLYSRCTTIKQIVFDAVPREELRREWSLLKPRYRAAINYCRECNMAFHVIGERELSSPIAHNALFLRRYRDYPTDEATEDILIHFMRILQAQNDARPASSLITPHLLLLASFAYEPNRLRAIAQLWKLMDSRVILHADPFTEYLTMHSSLWIDDEDES